MHVGFARVVTEAVSAVVVLVAFGAGVRLLAGQAFGFGRRPRLRVTGAGYRGGLVPRLLRGGVLVVVLAARFASGAPLGRRRTDATFLSAGTRVASTVPGWFTRAEPGRWAFLPGWQRAAVRWAVVAAAAGLYIRPLVALAALGWLALVTALALAPRWRRWRYARAVIRPVYLQLCQYLGTDPADKPGRWLDIPPGFAANPDAVITLTYPQAWNPDAARQRAIDEVIRRHLGSSLVPRFSAFDATWVHPPAPPREAPFDGYELPAHRIHMATLAGGRRWIADLENEEPHLFIAAGTGGGKTSAASVPAAHTRAHGWLVDILDPKRRSYIDRATGADVLTNVPGIRVHTDVETMMWALEEFFLSMLGVNIAVGERTARPEAFPQRLMVIDEFGTFASMAGRMWRRTGGKGNPPALDQRRQIEWQGRQAGHRLVVAVHQPNLRLFGDSDSRGQYGYRLVTGAYTASLWRMTFGFAPPIEWDARIKGRGVAGVGEAAELIHEAQLAWMPPAERRRYALSGPPPPDWFTAMQPAPWIDARVISEGEKLAGVSLIDVPPASVPPGQHTPIPAQTRWDVTPDVPPADDPLPRWPVSGMTRPGKHRAPAPHDEPPSGATAARPGKHRAAAPPGESPAGAAGPQWPAAEMTYRPGRHHAPAPPDEPPEAACTTPDQDATTGGEALIIGIAAAARYLGYDKPDSFRRARTRRPIPGEGKTPDGRPCWTPQVLRNWQSSRKIAGKPG